MQHIAKRHSLKGMIRTAGMLTLISMISGDASSLAAVASELSSLSFQREDEEEADREGMRALQRARLDPAAMVRMYEKLTEASPEMSGALRYLSTHPLTADRVEKLKRMAAEAQYSPEPVRLSAPWDEVRMMCR
jgi:predicted Zn-dependent protease